MKAFEGRVGILTFVLAESAVDCYIFHYIVIFHLKSALLITWQVLYKYAWVKILMPKAQLFFKNIVELFVWIMKPAVF